MSKPLSVPQTVHMDDLLSDKTCCKNIASHYPDIERILMQIQRDVVTEENRDSVGPTLLALKHVQDTFLLFQAKGAALIQQENKADAKANR
jgi:hypothetical protein